MINRLLRLLSRVYASLSADLLAYTVLPASLILIGVALYPDEFERNLRNLSETANIDLSIHRECSGKLGMEVGNIKLAFLKLERTYWNRDCADLWASTKMMELGAQLDDRPIQALGLVATTNLIPNMKQATRNVARMFNEATSEDLSIFENATCQWRVKRGRQDVTFGLVCPRSRRALKSL